jgi:acetyl-CoA acetyltransferase
VTGGAITSYFYYAPWGLTSQDALYALFFQRHKRLYGTTEEQLGAVAVAFRRHACLNPNAVMQKPLTIGDYLKAPYIAEPLRLYDYCLINTAASPSSCAARTWPETSGTRRSW